MVGEATDKQKRGDEIVLSMPLINLQKLNKNQNHIFDLTTNCGCGGGIVISDWIDGMPDRNPSSNRGGGNMVGMEPLIAPPPPPIHLAAADIANIVFGIFCMHVVPPVPSWLIKNPHGDWLLPTCSQHDYHAFPCPVCSLVLDPHWKPYHFPPQWWKLS